MEEMSIHLTRTIDSPLKAVFNAWLDKKLLSRFMTPILGMPEPRVEADGREGGDFTIYMQVGDKEIPHKGKFLEITPFEKIAFSWESPFSPPGSVVTIRFREINHQKTEIDFQHIKFKGEEERSDHERGWSNILLQLERVLHTENIAVA